MWSTNLHKEKWIMWIRVVLGCILLAASFGASAKTINCSACTSVQRMTKAKQAGPRTHYMFDLAKPSNTFKVTVTNVCEVQWDGRRVCHLETWFAAPEPAVRDYFNRIAQGSERYVSINGNLFPQDGYEMLEFPQLQSNINLYLRDSGTIYFADMWNFVTSVAPFDLEIQKTVLWTMPDGSTSLYVYDKATMTWKLVPETTKDSEGNRIPDTLQSVAGGAGSTMIYTFQDPNNWRNFTVRIVDLGASVQGTVTVGRIITVSCSQTTQGIICTIKQS
ncbi:hypothetical protein [Agrilutibacter solisilvae]|uniref:Uncharacterized protein n=1 Tax=Agrilutibacter solisilvae TaxID=2763317 RepID=A0A975ARN6_9GAMM|nr:hypothetical protein [Lysobacter solisilvae]QSX78079.1 hypothetical protein I8J32_015435 [Lysobacter solisilvae]